MNASLSRPTSPGLWPAAQNFSVASRCCSASCSAGNCATTPAGRSNGVSVPLIQKPCRSGGGSAALAALAALAARIPDVSPSRSPVDTLELRSCMRGTVSRPVSHDTAPSILASIELLGSLVHGIRLQDRRTELPRELAGLDPVRQQVEIAR